MQLVASSAEPQLPTRTTSSKTSARHSSPRRQRQLPDTAARRSCSFLAKATARHDPTTLLLFSSRANGANCNFSLLAECVRARANPADGWSKETRPVFRASVGYISPPNDKLLANFNFLALQQSQRVYAPHSRILERISRKSFNER